MKLIGWRCPQYGLKLTFRICPKVLFCTCHIEGARCNQCKQHMLIQRQFIFPSVITIEVVGKPMRETGIYHPNRLPEPAPGQRSASRSRSEEHTSELQSRGHLVCRLL